jgi:hypothetical protein
MNSSQQHIDRRERNRRLREPSNDYDNNLHFHRIENSSPTSFL